MKYIFALVSVLMISGCASTAIPNLFNGSYYMAGDKNCKSLAPVSATLARCFDKNGRKTELRSAMSQQDLQMWQWRMQQNQMTVQQMQQVGQDSRNIGFQALQNSQQYSIPQTPALAPNGYSNGITYRQVGNSLIGSNGVTYRQTGNSILGSDGTKCQIAGQNIICR